MANPAACMVSSSNSVRWIQMQRSTDMDLKSQLQELIPEQQDRPKKLKSEHGKVQLGNITVDMVIGGMRGMTGLLWETSLLDPEELRGTTRTSFTIEEDPTGSPFSPKQSYDDQRRTRFFLKHQIPTWFAIGSYIITTAIKLPHSFSDLAPVTEP
ncbi:uncharacterized protein LOC108834983 isoform X3 [Raphanus sativus]|uniref:Uncharacterized protein LOC108834983 isoform X3 n=1 Tax=Raphanus sativus TaxID=3726 RepID=A0A9W3CYB8_RAPSA|nr:uncharacterized protein LOC108834983 isoform X3 [Raphanus sativus]